MEYYIFLIEINMKENGKIIKKMDMEYIIIQMDLNMKVNGKIIKKWIWNILFFKCKKI